MGLEPVPRTSTRRQPSEVKAFGNFCSSPRTPISTSAAVIASTAGFRCFTEVGDFKRYVEVEILAEGLVQPRPAPPMLATYGGGCLVAQFQQTDPGDGRRNVAQPSGWRWMARARGAQARLGPQLGARIEGPSSNRLTAAARPRKQLSAFLTDSY